MSKHKRVGIITLFDTVNYGNRLQNYAVQVVIDRLGFRSITLDYQKYANSFIPKLKSAIMHLLHVFSGPLRGSKELAIRNNNLEADTNEEMRLTDLRRESFVVFNTKHIRSVVISNTFMILKMKIKMNFECFVIGSDQVWNPLFGVMNPFKFATFSKRRRRIAYAASFGVSTIPFRLRKDYETGLNRIPHISVREDTAAQIVKELTGKNITVVIDPTMMLDGTEWRAISKRDGNRPMSPYVLTYFLGENTSELEHTIAEIRKRQDIEIIKLNSKSDEQRYIVDPAAFIDYIDNAALVLTDSFHGTVFSILLGRPFLVFDRAHMNSRLDTLLGKFELEHRRIGNIDNVEDLFSTDYSHVNGILKRERLKALEFLVEALKPDDLESLKGTDIS